MKFSCIIPAYNEGPRIKRVLEVLLSCDMLDEIIVINDGSTDNTQDVLDNFQHPKLQKIYQKNTGKSRAVLHGITIAQGDYIVMIDSDLLFLNTEHIGFLLAPIEKNESDVTLSIRANSLFFYKWIGTDFVTGERVVPRDMFDNKDFFYDGPGFGLEVKINEKIIEKGYRRKNILLPGVITPRKSEKIGYIRGTIADIKMIIEILSTISIWKIIYQIWYFSRFHRHL